MPHLDAGLIHELVDGEIPSSELPPIQAHLTMCAECRTQLEAARRYAADAEQLLEVLDDEATAIPVTALIGYARHRPIRNLAWAASVLVAVGVGYAVRGTVPQPRTAAAARDSAPAPTVATPVATTAAPLPEPTDRLASSDKPATTGRANELERARRPDRRDAVTDEIVSRPEARAAETPPPPPPALAAAPTAVAGASGVAARDAARSSVNQLAERASAFARQAPATSKVSATLDTITFGDAMRLMNGRLRLIDGMIPTHLESLGAEVRVVYRVVEGELILAQQIVDGEMIVRIIAPAGFRADSVAKLRARVRD